MSTWAYYNEIDLYAAEWLENLISANLIPDGIVDRRSISEVDPNEIKSFTQCHFFAGIGGWALAGRLAGWPDDRPLWTGSCPCQPFSVAGKGAGTDDERHLWPDFFHLIRSCRPDVIMGEQVAGSAGYGWLDGVRSCLEDEDYSCGAVDIPACTVNAPHRRNRIYWVAEPKCHIGKQGRAPDKSREGDGAKRAGPSVESGRRSDIGKLVFPIDPRLERYTGNGNHGNEPGRQPEEQDRSVTTASTTSSMDHPQCASGRKSSQHRANHINEIEEWKKSSGRLGKSGSVDCMDNSSNSRRTGQWLGGTSPASRDETRLRESSGRSTPDCFWHNFSVAHCLDSKARRIEPGSQPLAHGVPARVGKLRAYGNAIVPPLAAEVIRAYMDTGK